MSEQKMEIFEHEGTEYKLGCLVPEVRPMTFAAYADAGPMLTREQSISILQDPKRVPSRIRFQGVKWIMDQGQRGSCNGFAGAGALMRSRVRRGLDYVKLSGEGLYAQINNGLDEGSLLDAGMKALMKNGCPPADLVKWQTYLWRDISQEARSAMHRFRAFEAYRVDTEEEMLAGLASGFDGVVAVQANKAFMKVDAEGRVLPTDGPGNHAVGVDDVRVYKGKVEFDMFNSWNLRYGVQGRGWISWETHLRGPSKNHAFYLIRSTTDDPTGENPLPL